MNDNSVIWKLSNFENVIEKLKAQKDEHHSKNQNAMQNNMI